MIHTVQSIRKALRDGQRIYYIRRWIRRVKVRRRKKKVGFDWIHRRLAVSDVRYRRTRPGQGAGWIEVQTGKKKKQWEMVLSDKDLEII